MTAISGNASEDTQPFWTKMEYAGLIISLGMLLLFRYYNLCSYDVLSADGTSYGPTGRAFFATGNYRVFSYISGPVYPFFVGLFDLLLKDIELSLRLVSVFFSTLTVGTVYCMGRAFHNRQSATSAALICGTLPFLHGMSGIDITEPTFTFFLLTGTYLFWKGYTTPNRGYAIAGGFVLAVAYLTRSEGFITWFGLSVFACIDICSRLQKDGKRVAVSVLVPFWVAFFVLFAPYLIYLRIEMGEWHLSGKASGNAQIIREYRGQTTVDQRFTLDKSGKDFDTAQGEGLGKLLLTEPELFFGNIRKNLQELPGALNRSMPWYLLLAVFSTFVLTPWRRIDLTSRAAVISICSPLIIYVLFHVQQRGFYPYISALCISAGHGIARASNLLSLPRLPLTLKSWLAVFVLALPLSGFYLYQDVPRQQPPYNFQQDGGRRGDKHIGLRLKSVLPLGSIIMTRSGRIAFYAGSPMIIPPQASFEEIVKYAIDNKATHLVATFQLISMRPQLEFLFAPILHPEAPFTPPAELEVVYIGQEPGGLPYMVYRFRQATQESIRQ